ncbi:MAG TPA: alcohol dehydrogenase catalytic domain-containing protein [Acidimicrobiia bacterium]|nr:alcohol dehydrogenase catalytic domain-containing protein [Acidimicrobiia bacterium]
MRAVRVQGPGVIEVGDVPEPDAGSSVLVRVGHVGICGTDVKILAGKIPVDYPRIMGHEMVGEVVAAPPESPYHAGTRVLVDPGVACGWCHMCRAGRFNICVNGGLLGRDVDGVFTEYAVVPFNRLILVPPSISDKASGVLQVLGTCVHAVKTLDPFPGQVAAVIGLGVAGQLITQLLRLRGMTVVGITRSEWKRELATTTGTHYTASPDQAADVLAEVSSGRGPDVVVEAVGTEATLARAIELVGTGGEVLVYGTLTGGETGLPYYQLYHKELTLHNPRAAVVGDYADGVDLAASGRLTLEPIVTHELGLEEAEKAFELVHDPSSLKVSMRVG